MLAFWLLILLLIALVFALPWWPYNRTWGFWPGGVVLALLILWLALVWWGFIVFAWPWTV